MAKLLGGTQVYGNATINSYLVVSGNADLSGGNISVGNGNTTVTSITVPSKGNSYQSSPTITISAPTTLYGATATANVSLGVVAVAANIGGGTGYSVGNVLTAVGNGSVISNATFTVTSVGNAVGGSGNITGLSVTTPGTYYFANTNPITFTGGGGSGANAFVYYGLNTPVMTYNGLGYTEPATVTLSGGSPATAATIYPLVGGPGNVNILGNYLSFRTIGGEILRIQDNNGYSPAGIFYNPLNIIRDNGSNVMRVQASNQNLRFESSPAGATTFGTTSGAETQVQITPASGAVNYINLTGAATGGTPTISAQGTDNNVTLALLGKGSGYINLGSNGNPYVLQIAGVASGSNYNNLRIQNGAGGNTSPVISTWGIDSNISMTLQTAGTNSNINLVANGAVNLSTGGTVTALTLTAAGSAYTSVPSITISPPTTAGGVQATARCVVFVWSNPFTTAGTGYTVGNTLTAIGGTGTAYSFTVTSIDGSGGVTGASIVSYGAYTVTPTNPVTFTGGSGSGFTSNMTWTVGSSITILSAGSGYVEQPTVTFSSSGGSGAAAYATVGSGTVVRSLGNTLSFNMPAGGTGLQIYDAGGPSGSTGAYWKLGTNYSSAQAVLLSTATGYISSTGTNPVSILTNSTAQEQFRVAHTASAVNYVQVTGAATNNNPVISAQGSDVGVGLTFQTKSANNFVFQNGAAQKQLVIDGTRTGVNFLGILSAATGVAPSIGASTSSADTNVDFALVSKGTGNVTTANPVVITNANVSTSTGTGALIVSGGAGVAGNVNIGANLYVNTIITTAGSNGNLTIDPDGVGDLIISPATEVFIQSTLTAANTGSGALVVAGGVGIAGNVFAGNVLATGFFYANGTAFVSGSTSTINPAIYFGKVTASTAPTLIDTLPVTGNNLVRWTTTSYDSVYNQYRSSTIDSVNNGVTVNYNEYSFIVSNVGTTVATFTSNITSGNINLWATGNTASVAVTFERVVLGSGTTSGYLTAGPAGAAGATGATGTIANTASWIVTTNTTASTSTTTGALQVAGGTGIAGNLFAGNSALGANMGNYLQVNGAVAGSAAPWPILSTQGTDSTVHMWISTKGQGAVRFQSQAGTYTQLRIDGTVAAQNALNIFGGASGVGPTLGVIGNDTNSDLNLSTNGTGNVQTTSPVRITNANVSTSTGTGALIVAGGVGIAGNVYSGDIYSSGNVVATTYFVGNGSQLTGISSAMAWTVTSSNITVSKNNGYFVDTTTGPKTLTLPASATIGDTVRINDLAGTFASNNLTVGANGGKIQGVADDLKVSVNQKSFGLVYSNSTYGWKLLEL